MPQATHFSGHTPQVFAILEKITARLKSLQAINKELDEARKFEMISEHRQKFGDLVT